MKKYPDELVTKLHTNVEQIKKNGVTYIFKPVPDSEARNILDPRIKEVIKKKAAAKSKSRGYSLYHTRNRPDKVNYDITHEDVAQEEKLIKIGNERYIDVFIFKSANFDNTLPILIYLHGGGFTAGNIDLYRNEMRYLAETTQCLVIFPEYRLAPENPYPAAIDDCLETLQWVKKNHVQLGVGTEKVVMIGDSAGGNLINSVLVKNEFKDIKLIVELYPVIDNQISKLEIADKFPIVSEERDLVYSRLNKMKNSQDESLYLMDKVKTADPIVNLGEISDFNQIPAMTIISSQYDLLKLGSDAFIKKAAEQGKKINSIRYLGCDHGFFDLIGIAPQAEEVCLEIADEIHKVME
ncbi:alpha/beta hydrolase [Lactobacillus sp. ESL0785]|uniref:alpha/beta hydrolase n=1 Tax=Lactobacillus sp. ESL0785 TaxID=2983232 RepID=UPI0023F71E85|nr:alpha/beta hydrolase [Lactobacillus sp. ESL0785]WEV71315.1 alpha/beta hydrolase [Lactobacillus sp. ESL0785]